MNGRALVRSEFEAILMDLNEAQAIEQRRRFGEPIDQELTAKVVSAHHRLSYVARVLLGAVALLILAGCLVYATDRVFSHSDAQTIRNPANP